MKIATIHENFAHQYVKYSGNVLKAAKAVHVNTQTARNWLKDQDVCELIFELQLELNAHMQVDRNLLSRNLLEVYGKAQTKGQLDQMRKTTMDLGKLHGLIVDRQDINTNHQFQIMRDVTIDGQALQFDVGVGVPLPSVLEVPVHIPNKSEVDDLF